MIIVKKIKRMLYPLFLVGTLFFAYNCSDSAKRNDLVNRYGKAFNDDRIKKHLPIIEDSWDIRVFDSSHVQWSKPRGFFNSTSPEHIWKISYFKESILISEEDAFNLNQGDSIGNRLIIVASLQHLDSIKIKFIKHYYRSYPPSESAFVSYEFADSVLRAWGFKNFYSYVKKKDNLLIE